MAVTLKTAPTPAPRKGTVIRAGTANTPDGSPHIQQNGGKSKGGKKKPERNMGREMEAVKNKAGAKLGVLLGQTAGHETRPTVRATLGTTVEGNAASVTSAIRWMGKEGWSFKTCRAVLDNVGLKDVKDNTIRCQVQSGQHHPKGIHGPAADLDKASVAFLKALAKKHGEE